MLTQDQIDNWQSPCPHCGDTGWIWENDGYGGSEQTMCLCQNQKQKTTKSDSDILDTPKAA